MSSFKAEAYVAPAAQTHLSWVSCLATSGSCLAKPRQEGHVEKLQRVGFSRWCRVALSAFSYSCF